MSPSESVRALACRLFVDPPAEGAWQMAVDEVLLQSAAEQGTASLRFYGWSRPTLSLGYFQHCAGRAMHCASRDCPLVRRQTGGGAIVHDRELTYSLSMPLAHPLAQDAGRLYDAAHEALVRVLAGLGVHARIWRQPAGGQVEAAEPVGTGDQAFLCFQRRASGDVLVGDDKICGSAQRRRRGAMLQHGSLLLAASERAPELPGIGELTGKRLNRAELTAAWQQGIAARLALEPAQSELSDAELQAAGALAAGKYSADVWNHRR